MFVKTVIGFSIICPVDHKTVVFESETNIKNVVSGVWSSLLEMIY